MSQVNLFHFDVTSISQTSDVPMHPTQGAQPGTAATLLSPEIIGSIGNLTRAKTIVDVEVVKKAHTKAPRPWKYSSILIALPTDALFVNPTI